MTIGSDLAAVGSELDAALQALQTPATASNPPFDPTPLQAQIDAINALLAPIVTWFNAPETPPVTPVLTEADLESGMSDLATILSASPPATLLPLMQKVVTNMIAAGVIFPTAPVPTPTPVTPTWTTVAQQHGTFILKAQSTVRYGEIATNRFNTKTLAAGTYTCDNTQFGDPAPGIDAKICQVSS